MCAYYNTRLKCEINPPTGEGDCFNDQGTSGDDKMSPYMKPGKAFATISRPSSGLEDGMLLIFQAWN